MANRRSPRTLSTFANNLLITPTTHPHHTVLIISLCNLAGWSADAIMLKLRHRFNIHVTPFQVWSFNWKFLLTRAQGSTFSEEEMDLMRVVARRWGIAEDVIERNGVDVRRLSETPEPISVVFPEVWNCVSPHIAPRFWEWRGNTNESE
jgi:hypothetical protein